MNMATFFIVDVYRITGVGVVPVGQVKGGILKVGMKLALEGKIMEIKNMQMHHKDITEAKEGDQIGFSLVNGDYDLLKKYARKCVDFY